MSQTIIYVIADYGDLHDLAFAEVVQRLHAELGPEHSNINTFAIPAFDTVATGFTLAQTALNSRLGERQKFFVNTAPRKDDLKARSNNAGEGFVYARLHNGVEVCAVNSGYSLSFIKDGAVEVRRVNCDTQGSQFRSRDIFPAAFARIVHGDHSLLGEDMRDFIPDPPQDVICYTDGYGNMKCSIDPATLEGIKNKNVILDVQGQQQVVRVADGIFGVSDGEFCISAGSSGWTLPDGRRVRFTEVVKRGGNAAMVFGRPPGGQPVMWRLVN